MPMFPVAPVRPSLKEVADEKLIEYVSVFIPPTGRVLAFTVEDLLEELRRRLKTAAERGGKI